MSRNRWPWGAVLLMLTAAAGSTTGVVARAPAVSVNAGVYTEAQARQGERLFSQHCSRCHDTARFKGEAFVATWRGPLSQLFDRVQETMPEDNPGTLRPQVYGDVIAYFLSLNGYPTGTEPLSGTADAMEAVELEPRDPSR